MAHDVFISYSTKDKHIADAVCAKLEEQKIRCWIAPRDIPAGQNFAASIINAINDSRVFVLLWSASANASEHILNEINQAFDQGITIIPFRIQDVQPTPEMRYYFGRTHWLDALTPPLEKHIQTLSETIQALLSRQPQTAVASPEPAPAAEPSPAVTGQPEPDKHVPPAAAQKVKLAEPRMKPAKNKALVPALAGVSVLALLAVMYFTGFFDRLVTKTPTPTEHVIGVTPTIATPSLTPTPTQTPTPTPLPGWVDEIARPILLAVADKEPVFADDFSSEDTLSNWQFQADGENCPEQPYLGYYKGSLTLSNNSTCFVHLTPDITGVANYVLQVELVAMDLPGTRINLRAGDNSLQLNTSGEWSWTFHDSRNNASQTLGEGTIDFDPLLPHTITLIGYQNWTAVLIDDIPLVSGENPYRTANQFFQVSLFGASYNQFVEFDNLKIWNLDAVSGLPEVTP